jgi:hypothetical protein
MGHKVGHAEVLLHRTKLASHCALAECILKSNANAAGRINGPECQTLKGKEKKNPNKEEVLL